jgi:hypothetical protein
LSRLDGVVSGVWNTLAGVAGCHRAAPSLWCACGENNGSWSLVGCRNTALVTRETPDVGDADIFVDAAAREE